MNLWELKANISCFKYLDLKFSKLIEHDYEVYKYTLLVHEKLTEMYVSEKTDIKKKRSKTKISKYRSYE